MWRSFVIQNLTTSCGISAQLTPADLMEKIKSLGIQPEYTGDIPCQNLAMFAFSLINPFHGLSLSIPRKRGPNKSRLVGWWTAAARESLGRLFWKRNVPHDWARPSRNRNVYDYDDLMFWNHADTLIPHETSLWPQPHNQPLESRYQDDLFSTLSIPTDFSMVKASTKSNQAFRCPVSRTGEKFQRCTMKETQSFLVGAWNW